MKLNELTATYEKVDPVKFKTDEQDIYSNLNRARTTSNNYKNWKVGGGLDTKYINWKVKNDNSSWINPFSKIGGQKNQTEDEKIQWMQFMKDAYELQDVPEPMIKILIAQDAIESGWGTKTTGGSYNYGNITAGNSWTGRTKNGGDTDKYGNPITQKWRCYNNVQEYVQDKIKILQNNWNVGLNDDINEFLHKIQDNKSNNYAESTTYKDDIKEVYKSVNRRWNQIV